MLPKHPIIATATAVAVAAARHSSPPWSLRGFILVVVVIVIVTAVTTIFPPLFCDLFDCSICSVVVSSPLPHPVAIPPTASAIVIVVIIVVVVAVVIIAVSSSSSSLPITPPYV